MGRLTDAAATESSVRRIGKPLRAFYIATMQSPSFDIMAALRRMVAVYWAQFAPIVLLGFLFLTLPSLFVRAALGDVSAVGDPTVETLVQTGTALLAMIFAAAVNAGVLATLAGRPLDPHSFMRGGLMAARPGVIVALVIGAIMVGAVIVRLLAGFAGLGNLLVHLLIYGVLAWFLVSALVALPAAIAERHMPLDAIRRSFMLTRGNRARLAGLAAILLLALLPAMMIVNSVVFGPVTTSAQAQAIVAEMTLLSPGLWIGELFSLLILGFLSTAPAVAYMQLVGRSA
jgi:hypothetical protein